MVATVTGGVPSAPARVSGTEDLYKAACPSATVCMAAGERAQFTQGLIADTSI